MENSVPYAADRPELPSYLEKVQCQWPALQLLIQMGYL